VSEPSIVVPRRRVLDPAARRQRAQDSKARQRTRRRLFAYFVDNGFADDDELAFFLDEFLGLAYPRVAACPNHVAPFQILADLYFDRVRAMLIFASCASGKTLTFAVMNLLDGSFRLEGIDITNAAASRDQAVKCYRYFLGFHKDPLIGGLLAHAPPQERRPDLGAPLAGAAGVGVIAVGMGDEGLGDWGSTGPYRSPRAPYRAHGCSRSGVRPSGISVKGTSSQEATTQPPRCLGHAASLATAVLPILACRPALGGAHPTSPRGERSATVVEMPDVHGAGNRDRISQTDTSRGAGGGDLLPLPHQEFCSTLVENADGPEPWGAKGMGENGLMPTAPAVAKALPLTREHVRTALAGRKRAGPGGGPMAQHANMSSVRMIRTGLPISCQQSSCLVNSGGSFMRAWGYLPSAP
jgi:hypothetical protein